MRTVIFYALLLYVAFSIDVLVGYAVTFGCIVYILYKSVPSFYAKKGNAEFNDRNFEKALYYYEKAYKTGRASAPISLTYGILLLRLGKVEEAEVVFNMIILSRDKKVTAAMKNKTRQYRALAYFKTGRVDDALEEAYDIFENFKSSVSYGLLGYLKIATGAPADDIYRFCTEAYEYNSDDRDIADNMVVALILKGDLEKAKEYADKLLKSNPEFTEAHYHAAVVYKKLGDNKKALEALESIDAQCTRTYLTTVSVEEIEELKRTLSDNN